MRKAMIAAVMGTVVAAGCANPNAPTALDPIQVWATAHAHEACVLATKVVNGAFINYGVLVPLTALTPAMKVMPISYCNPAE